MQKINEAYVRQHEAELHVICTCGRSFTRRGLSAHLGQVRWRKLPHPALPTWSLRKEAV